MRLSEADAEEYLESWLEINGKGGGPRYTVRKGGKQRARKTKRLGAAARR
jgi:hypothetical protein